jgi:hypothetical protein
VPEDFRFDLFLSHSAKDKPVVRELAARLQRDGARVWVDEEQIKPGDSIPAKIEEGLEHSRVLVLCMSANAFGSDWAQLEAGTFRFRDPLNRERRFIPLRLDDAPIKGSIAQFLYIDWRPSSRNETYKELIEACVGTAPHAESEQREQVGWSVARIEEVVLDRESRQEFPKKTRDTLAQRVGMRCSNPACRRLTTGPHSDPEKALNFGVAAHIETSLVDAPRDSSSLSKTARSSIENAIWLCQNCARLVDADPKRYSVELLRTWKNEAENEATKAVDRPEGWSVPTRQVSPAEGPVVKLTPRQMVAVFFGCAFLGAATFHLNLVAGAVFLSLAVAIGLFGFLGGVAHVENRWANFGGSVGAFVSTLLIILKYGGGGTNLVDIQGAVYVDGQPATKATATLLETAYSDNRREITEGNPGVFEFRGVQGPVSRVKLRIEVDAPIRLSPVVVEKPFVPSQLIRIDLPKPVTSNSLLPSNVSLSPEELAMPMKHFEWRLEVPLMGLLSLERLAELIGYGETNLAKYDFETWNPRPHENVQFGPRPRGLGSQAGKFVETFLGGTGVNLNFYWVRGANPPELGYTHGFRFTDRRNGDNEFVQRLPPYAIEHMLPECEVTGGSVHTFGVSDNALMRIDVNSNQTAIIIEWTTEAGSQLILSDFSRLGVTAEFWEASGFPGRLRVEKVSQIPAWRLSATIDYRWKVQSEAMRWTIDAETGKRKTSLSRFQYQP